MFGDAIEFDESMLGVRPERLNSVDVVASQSKLVVAMIDSEMLFITDINQTIITPPRVRMNHRFQINLASDNLH